MYLHKRDFWWRWLKRSEADRPGEHIPPLSEDETGRENEFRLESLEPRILLSADPVLGELARWIEDDGSNDPANEVAAIVQEIDSFTESAITQDLENQSKDPETNKPTIVWPEG